MKLPVLWLQQKLTPERIEEIASEFDECWPVNYNSPAQTVVAMNKDNLEAFCEKIKSEKVEQYL